MPELTVDVPEGHAGPDRPVRRGFLDREQILHAAARYIDDHGLGRLTMRRLGAELGVEAMALYRYVPSREKLLDAVAEGLVDELLDRDDIVVRPPHWQAYLQALAHAVRDVALQHPQIFPIVATRPPAAPWLRPPLRSLRWVESFLESLAACGFSDGAAVYTYRAFSTFLLGHLVLEVSALGADIGLLGANAEPEQEPDLSDYPQLVRLSSQLATDHGRQEFEESLESMLDRVEASLTS